MEREISVRFWDEKLSTMWQPIELKKLLGYCIFQRMPNSDGYLALKDRYDKMKWLFSTGLKDKNGKEIYEGDILEDEAKTIPAEYQRGIVTYNDVDACYDCLSIPHNHRIAVEVWSKYLEVIGNIYENPELLKLKEND